MSFWTTTQIIHPYTISSRIDTPLHCYLSRTRKISSNAEWPPNCWRLRWTFKIVKLRRYFERCIAWRTAISRLRLRRFSCPGVLNFKREFGLESVCSQTGAEDGIADGSGESTVSFPAKRDLVNSIEQM